MVILKQVSPEYRQTKLLIFHSKYNKKNYENIIIKLQGVRLEHSKSIMGFAGKRIKQKIK